MSLAIIDAREWQKLVDLKTGERETAEGPLIETVRGLLREHPYPGDLDERSNRWVTDTALDLVARYRPELVFLCYAQLYFTGRFVPQDEAKRQADIGCLVDEVKRFTRQSGFEPVIVGTGRTVVLQGEIDVSGLDGLAIATHGSTRYTGLHQASARDIERLTAMPNIERVVTREAWINLFGHAGPDPSMIPEHLLVAREGWTFKTDGIPLRKVLRVPGTDFELPLSTTLGEAQRLVDIRGLIERQLGQKKIALIMIEGLGCDDFHTDYKACANGVNWFHYEPGEAMYLTLASGRHRVFDYPTGYKYFHADEQQRDFPYSGYFTGIPEGTLGMDFPGRSIAVGNRSMLTHMVFGADVAVECFARNLYNQGCFAAIHRQDKY